MARTFVTTTGKECEFVEPEFVGHEWRYTAGGWQHLVAVWYWPATGRYTEWAVED